MVRVTISETYDLSTQLNKMSLVGIHTPKMENVIKSYGGLLSNHKMYRLHHCDVKLACASVLPADPLQVGTDPEQIAPQDMFNPILYKAVSNQSMNTFELRMQGLKQDDSDLGDFYGSSVDKTDNVSGYANEFGIYYGLLSNRKGWKVAHPQRGLQMSNLRPYVYERLFNAGDSAGTGSGNSNGIRALAGADDGQVDPVDKTLSSIRGRPRPLPALPTTTILPSNVSGNLDLSFNGNVKAQQSPVNKDMTIYCGLIVLPPAQLHKFYYRLVIRWYVDIFGVRPYNDIEPFIGQWYNGYAMYGSDYFPIGTPGSASKTMGMVDVADAEIEKVMDGI